MIRVEAAIRRQLDRTTRDHAWWTQLRQLFQDRKLAEFHATYAEYLEDSGIVSLNRQLLHDAAILTAERLRAGPLCVGAERAGGEEV